MAIVGYCGAACLLVLAGLQCNAMHLNHPDEVGPAAEAAPTYMMGGDIVLTQEQWVGRLQRKMMSKVNLWPRNHNEELVVPYKVIDDRVNLTRVKIALGRFAAVTCMTFKQIPETDSSVVSYLSMDMARTCQSMMGYNPKYPTNVSVAGYECDLMGMTHELGHAFGFNHEHARNDRDDYLYIKHDNIKPSAVYQFQKMKTHNHGVPYDYTSIMHYEGRAAGVGGRRVMLTRDARFQSVIGHNKELSFMDIKLFNLAYGCIKSWATMCGVKTKCKNGGYLGVDCSCVCPLGSSGSKCKNLKMSYNDALIAKKSPLSKIYTKTGSTATSPGYPSPAQKKESYAQVFQAPECQRAVITFKDFDVYGKDPEYNECRIDSVELRSDITVAEGSKYCGDDISAGDSFKSDKSMLILHYAGYDYSKYQQHNSHKGYKVVFTTEPIHGCKPGKGTVTGTGTGTGTGTTPMPTSTSTPAPGCSATGGMDMDMNQGPLDDPIMY